MSKPTLIEIIVILSIIIILVSLSLKSGDIKITPATPEDLNNDETSIIYIKPLFYKIEEKE